MFAPTCGRACERRLRASAADARTLESRARESSRAGRHGFACSSDAASDDDEDEYLSQSQYGEHDDDENGYGHHSGEEDEEE